MFNMEIAQSPPDNPPGDFVRFPIEMLPCYSQQLLLVMEFMLLSVIKLKKVL